MTRSSNLFTNPGGQKHRVEWTTPEEPTIWLAVHYGDRQ
jgi:cupin 2 domain-containing protein